MSYNILVTGCGGDIGQSIGKILNSSKLVENLYGCDISNKNAGSLIFNNFFLSFPCSDKKYLKEIKNFVNEKKIDFVIPASEPELRYLLKLNKIIKIGNAKLIIANKMALTIGFDKLKTANFLQENNFPYPETFTVNENINKTYPLIMKSRTGSGSSSVYIINDDKDYSFFSSKNPDFIVQEYLNGDNGEFTCGLFRDKLGETRSISFKRELTGGYSGYGEVINNKIIDHLLLKLANKIDLIGSINVQLRITKKKPIIFEINPRFSSTVLFRHLFGFKDLEWTIQDIIGIPLSKYNPPINGKKFYKGFKEYIDL